MDGGEGEVSQPRWRCGGRDRSTPHYPRSNKPALGRRGLRAGLRLPRAALRPRSALPPPSPPGAGAARAPHGTAPDVRAEPSAHPAGRDGGRAAFSPAAAPCPQPGAGERVQTSLHPLLCIPRPAQVPRRGASACPALTCGEAGRGGGAGGGRGRGGAVRSGAEGARCRCRVRCRGAAADGARRAPLKSRRQRRSRGGGAGRHGGRGRAGGGAAREAPARGRSRRRHGPSRWGGCEGRRTWRLRHARGAFKIISLPFFSLLSWERSLSAAGSLAGSAVAPLDPAVHPSVHPPVPGFGLGR